MQESWKKPNFKHLFYISEFKVKNYERNVNFYLSRSLSAFPVLCILSSSISCFGQEQFHKSLWPVNFSAHL